MVGGTYLSAKTIAYDNEFSSDLVHFSRSWSELLPAAAVESVWECSKP